jgi:2-dehydropantoate 2-reductase
VQQTLGPRIAVVGAGAVGSYYGGMLARADVPVTLIGRAAHVEAITAQGLFLDTVNFKEQIRISASTDLDAVRDAEIVLFCVKTFDTDEAAKSLSQHLTPGAILISLQNGVDNIERIRSAAKIQAIAAVVYVAVAMTGPGRIRHSGRGDLIIGKILPVGEQNPQEHDLRMVARLFVRAGISCIVSQNIEADLWVKMIMNCAYNAISALGRAKYSRAVRNPWTRDLMIRVTEEAIAVARASGVRLPEFDMAASVLKLADTMSEATSSTAQDIARGNRTEIDSLNGYIVRRGTLLGIATPVNQTLHALVKLLEDCAIP